MVGIVSAQGRGRFPRTNCSSFFFFFSGASCGDGAAEYVIIVEYRIWLERLVHIPGSKKLGQCGFADFRSAEIIIVKKLLNDGALR
jgi:hypothetical protein